MTFKNRKKNYPLYETTVFADFREMTENVAERFPDRVAFRFKRDPREKVASSITFRECRDYVRALATELHSMDLVGKRIAVVGPASVEWFLSYTAIMCVGAVTVPIDKDLPVADMASIIATAGCETVFFGADYEAKLREVAAETPVLTHFVSMAGEAEGAATVEALRDAGQAYLHCRFRSGYSPDRSAPP